MSLIVCGLASVLTIKIGWSVANALSNDNFQLPWNVVIFIGLIWAYAFFPKVLQKRIENGNVKEGN